MLHTPSTTSQSLNLSWSPEIAPDTEILPAHRPPSHRRDIPAPGRDLALNGRREPCLLEINCLLLESCSLQSLGSDTLSLKIINYLTVRLLPRQHAALAAPRC